MVAGGKVASATVSRQLGFFGLADLRAIPAARVEAAARWGEIGLGTS
jgi:hypothetical protein